MKKLTKKELITDLVDGSISRQIDKMDLAETWECIYISDAVEAAKRDYPSPRSFLTVKLYWTHGSGTYGQQAMACIWINDGGQYFQASGSKTGGCGYDKKSQAIADAFSFIGVPMDKWGYFGGSGDHEKEIIKLAKLIAGNKRFIIV